MGKIEYKIIRSFRKTISLQIKSGEVVVRAPKFSFKTTIDSFVQKHSNWIEKRLEQDKNKKVHTLEEIKQLKSEAKDYIISRTNKLAYKFGFRYNSIKITSAKTRWGSCTSKKNLNFSYRLILTPKSVIDYVIIHELSHLKHMNHSKKFWQEVSSMMPNYKESENWLKKEGTMIG